MCLSTVSLHAPRRPSTVTTVRVCTQKRKSMSVVLLRANAHVFRVQVQVVQVKHTRNK
jgi:hypothetical protein